jgi:hypothetical protein
MFSHVYLQCNSFCCAEAVQMLNLAIALFEDIGRLSMAAKHYKVLWFL